MQKLIKYVDEKNRSYPKLYRDEVTKIFYVRDRELGKISLETDNPKTAIPKIYTALEELKRRKEKAIVKESENLLLRDVFDKMIALKEADDIKPQTISRIKTIWRNSLEPFWGDIRPQDVNQEMADTFKDWHRNNRKGVQFVNVFKYLGNMFNICIDYGWIKPENCPKLELPKSEIKHHKAKKGRVIDDDEFKSIASHLDGRYLIIAKVAYYMGMRKMEIGSLESRRVISDKGKVYIDLSEHDTKTGIPRTIPVPSFIASVLLELKTENPHYIFPLGKDPKRHIASQNIDRAWRAAKELAHVQGRIRFHDLRHTAATNMARAEVNPILAVTYLGMSLVTYQKTYLKLSKEDLLSISENADKLFKKAEVTQ